MLFKFIPLNLNFAWFMFDDDFIIILKFIKRLRII